MADLDCLNFLPADDSLLFNSQFTKANFEGNLVVLVFEPNVQARVIEGDILAFNGTVARSDVFTYTNPTTNQIEELPIIY
ncbi:hypothetical protein OQ641_27560, partial [Klebsiella pneumoniae]